MSLNINKISVLTTSGLNPVRNNFGTFTVKENFQGSTNCPRTKSDFPQDCFTAGYYTKANALDVLA